jgi:mannosyltransferase
MGVAAEGFGRGPIERAGMPVADRMPPVMALRERGVEDARALHDAAPRRLSVAAATVGLVAVVVSAAGSWIPSLWGDEAASVLSALRPGGSLLTMLTHIDAVHGAYYLGLHAWVQVFGADPFSVRLPSALAVGACAAGVTWLCGRFGSLRFAVLAGALAAILPRLTYAGEEARSYAFSAAIATALWIVVVELLRRGRATWRGWAVYALVLAVGTYVFLYLALLSVAVGVVLALSPRRRQHLWHWLAASAVAAIVATPVVVLAVGQRQQIAFLAHRDVLTADLVLVKMWFAAWPFAVLAWALIAVALAGWIRARIGRRAQGAHPVLELETVAVAWLAVPTGILLAASPFVAGYTPRYGTFAAPAAAILMALGLRRLARLRVSRGIPRRTVAAIALVAVLIAAVPVWVGQRTPWAKNRSDWNDIAATIQQEARPGDAIVFDDSVRPSRRPRLALDTDPGAFAGLADVTLETSYADSTSWHSSVYSVPEAARLGRFDGVSRVWVVEYARDGAVDSDDAVSDLEALGYREAERISLHSSVVLLFTR